MKKTFARQQRPEKTWAQRKLTSLLTRATNAETSRASKKLRQLITKAHRLIDKARRLLEPLFETDKDFYKINPPLIIR